MLPLERSTNFWGRFLECVAVLLPLGELLLKAIMVDDPDSIRNMIFYMIRPLLAFGVILLTVRLSLARCGAGVIYCGIWAYLTREFCFDFTQIIQSFLGPDVGIGEFIVVAMCHGLVFSGTFFSSPGTCPLTGTMIPRN